MMLCLLMFFPDLGSVSTKKFIIVIISLTIVIPNPNFHSSYCMNVHVNK